MNTIIGKSRLPNHLRATPAGTQTTKNTESTREERHRAPGKRLLIDTTNESPPHIYETDRCNQEKLHRTEDARTATYFRIRSPLRHSRVVSRPTKITHPPVAKSQQAAHSQSYKSTGASFKQCATPAGHRISSTPSVSGDMVPDTSTSQICSHVVRISEKFNNTSDPNRSIKKKFSPRPCRRLFVAWPRTRVCCSTPPPSTVLATSRRPGDQQQQDAVGKTVVDIGYAGEASLTR